MRTKESSGVDRVVIVGVCPEVEAGRFPVKRGVGQVMTVEADVFTECEEPMDVLLKYRRADSREWNHTPMCRIGQERFRGSFRLEEAGLYRYTIDARPSAAAEGGAIDGTVEGKSERWVSYERELPLLVTPVRARYGAWYHTFPRSCGEPGRHGTLRDLQSQLPRIAAMGFDVVHVPPIHPIGRTGRKGRNGVAVAGIDDPGSPWAIGSHEGGHTAIHPELGTMADFRELMTSARSLGLEIALDIAFQCSPDHPYLSECPAWFRRAKDGTFEWVIDPPNEYRDVVGFDYACADWQGLWRELHRVVEFWIEQGVRVFRADNPHTKPFPFWEWLLAQVKDAHPEVMFLSEGLTRPAVMHHLAKVGFDQTYDYFPWKVSKPELIGYYSYLARPEIRDYFSPVLWVNTPQVLPMCLQGKGPRAFASRLVLAATLGSSYGVYGPAFEVCENRPERSGKEDYANSEQFELRHWDTERPGNLRDLITRVNAIRRQNPALQSNDGLCFHPVDNDRLVVFSKTSPDGTNVVVVVASTEPDHTQRGWVTLQREQLGMLQGRPCLVHDLLDDRTYDWSAPRNYVELGPEGPIAHVLAVRI
jgi:starch synthase (maltosyl-transferring)